MLMVNVFVTVLTMFPYHQMYLALSTDVREEWDGLTDLLFLLRVTNVFTTPVIFFLFNRSYRVCVMFTTLFHCYLDSCNMYGYMVGAAISNRLNI